MKNILVPIDFESKSLAAIHTAVNIAKQFDAKITILHVVDLNEKLSEMSDRDPFTGILRNDLIHDREQDLTRLRDLLEAEDLLGIVTPLVIVGDILDVVEKTIESKSIDFIVMGSDGTSGLKRLLVGSTAEKITQRIKIPILVQKTDESIRIKNMAFASDFSSENFTSLSLLKNLELGLEGDLHIVRINTPMAFKNTPTALKQMRTCVAQLKLSTQKITQYDYADIEEGLGLFGKENNIDCLVVAVQKNKSLGDHFHLSGLSSLINHVQIPLLIFKV